MIREETIAAARIVTLARPEKRNALSSEVARALGRAIERAGADESVRAVVLAAEGNVFAAGGDLDELAMVVGAAEGALHVLAIGQEIESILACPVPVIAAVSGDVYGGGCELLLLCDLAVMEDHARVSFRHARMGLSPAWGGTARLLERVGPTLAARLLFTSELVGAEGAVRLGLVCENVPSGGSMARALAIAEEIAKADREVIAAHKKLLRDALHGSRRAVKECEDETFRTLWGSAAHRRAMESFGSRTKPERSDGLTRAPEASERTRGR